jgi:ketosteroid isomerase-like protein
MGQLLTICVCWSLSFASTHADAGTDSRAVEVVQSKFAAFNQHDVAAIENSYASGARLDSPDYRNLVGNKPIAATYRKLFDAIPDAKDNIELLEAAGNHVYVQFTLTGHWNGVADKPVEARIIAVYKVADGHIVDDSTYYDRKAP